MMIHSDTFILNIVSEQVLHIELELTLRLALRLLHDDMTGCALKTLNGNTDAEPPYGSVLYTNLTFIHEMCSLRPSRCFRGSKQALYSLSLSAAKRLIFVQGFETVK